MLPGPFPTEPTLSQILHLYFFFSETESVLDKHVRESRIFGCYIVRSPRISALIFVLCDFGTVTERCSQVEQVESSLMSCHCLDYVLRVVLTKRPYLTTLLLKMMQSFAVRVYKHSVHDQHNLVRISARLAISCHCVPVVLAGKFYG